MIKYFAKKWVISQLNDVLKNISDNQKVIYWRNKVLQITIFLNNLQEYLKDNEITDEEADKIVEECKSLF